MIENEMDLHGTKFLNNLSIAVLSKVLCLVIKTSNIKRENIKDKSASTKW